MTDDSNMKHIERGEELVAQIRPILAGNDPRAQGAALAELVATFIASHAPPLRADALNLLDEAVGELIPVIEKQLFGAQGHPFNQVRGKPT